MRCDMCNSGTEDVCNRMTRTCQCYKVPFSVAHQVVREDFLKARGLSPDDGFTQYPRPSPTDTFMVALDEADIGAQDRPAGDKDHW